MFKLKPLAISGAFTIHGKVMPDERGFFCKTMHEGFFRDNGLEWQFAEQYYSVSHKNVVRGLHFQKPPFEHAKLVYCVSGSAVDVIVDLRKKAPTYGKCASVELNGKDAISVYVPKGVAHGFLAKEDETAMVYAVTSVYNSEADSGILWNSIDFDWCVKSPTLSARDTSFPAFNNFVSPFTGQNT